MGPQVQQPAKRSDDLGFFAGCGSGDDNISIVNAALFSSDGDKASAQASSEACKDFALVPWG